MQIITAYNNYLFNRGITEEICAKYNISWENKSERLIIPVYDINHKFLFNKYRKNPKDDSTTSKPKYTYDKGSSASLFGAQFITEAHHTIYICEGELDALTLNSQLALNNRFDILAVSSTGGCGTWNDDWNIYLKGKEVVIIYDTDVAGVTSSAKLSALIPGSKVAHLPYEFPFQPKDITEYYEKMNDKAKFISNFFSQVYIDRIKLPVTGVAITEKDKSQLQKYWVEKVKEMNKVKFQAYWAPMILQYVNKLNVYSTVTKNHIWTSNEEGDMTLAKIKTIPITSILPFKMGKAKCLWHKDKTASLSYYPDTNTVYCFGCQKYGDFVEVYQAVYKVSFKDAMKDLTKRVQNVNSPFRSKKSD